VEAMRRINCVEDLGDEIISSVSALLTLKRCLEAHRKSRSLGSRRKGCNNEERSRSHSSRSGHSVYVCVCMRLPRIKIKPHDTRLKSSGKMVLMMHRITSAVTEAGEERAGAAEAQGGKSCVR